ncbi:ATP-binding protein [Pirellulales bacterium]|nr:ATP-binding protein [Pirellulales bacterium]
MHLENIRCFEELTIHIDEPGKSVLILGDNGGGKSTLLRSLALGLCDESSAAALFRELPGEFVRRPKGQKHVKTGESGTISVDFEHSDKNEKKQRYRISTQITSGNLFERVSQRNPERKGQDSLFKLTGDRRDPKPTPIDETCFPWTATFVSGYGAGTRTQGSEDYRYYLPVDAVYPIFNYGVSLQNPELAVRRLIDAANKSTKNATAREKREQDILDWVKCLLAPILDLKGKDEIILTSNSILLRGPWGEAQLGEVGDGYRATVTWILDLLSWWFLYYFAPNYVDETFDDVVRKKWKEFRKQEPAGIVIIDEIEQHLHPRWQRRVLSSLQECFPLIQFVVTTHSPLVASGAEHFAVYQLEGQDSVGKSRIHPYGWLAEDILEAMGLGSSRAEQVSKEIDEFAELDLARHHRKLNKTERERLEKLRTRLQSLPGTDPIALSTELMNLAKALEKGQDGTQ